MPVASESASMVVCIRRRRRRRPTGVFTTAMDVFGSLFAGSGRSYALNLPWDPFYMRGVRCCSFCRQDSVSDAVEFSCHVSTGKGYKYRGWWSVWWMGTYSMVLSKAAFLHRKYLNMYTHNMPSSVHDYVARERNCEDIAMSFIVANATGAPPIWVKGKIYVIGSSGISSLKGHSMARNNCLNDCCTL